MVWPHPARSDSFGLALNCASYLPSVHCGNHPQANGRKAELGQSAEGDRLLAQNMRYLVCSWGFNTYTDHNTCFPFSVLLEASTPTLITIHASLTLSRNNLIGPHRRVVVSRSQTLYLEKQRGRVWLRETRRVGGCLKWMARTGVPLGFNIFNNHNIRCLS